MKIDNVGALFRFITPIMIGLTAYFGAMQFTDIKTDIKELAAYFTNHLSDHKTIEIILEKRLTALETLICGEKYGKK